LVGVNVTHANSCRASLTFALSAELAQKGKKYAPSFLAGRTGAFASQAKLSGRF